MCTASMLIKNVPTLGTFAFYDPFSPLPDGGGFLVSGDKMGIIGLRFLGFSGNFRDCLGKFQNVLKSAPLLGFKLILTATRIEVDA